MKIVGLMTIQIQKIGAQTKTFDINSLSILESLNESLIAIDLEGITVYLNKSAEVLFGYSKLESTGKRLQFITQHSEFELEHFLDKTKEGKTIIFRTQKQNKNGSILDLVVSTSPLFSEEKITGAILLIKEYSQIKNICFIPLTDEIITREQKRTFNVLRDIIVSTIGSDKKTINQIANDSGINWKTVEKHLTYLIGKKLLQEVFSSEYVRIFELTDNGRQYLNQLMESQKIKYITEE